MKKTTHLKAIAAVICLLLIPSCQDTSEFYLLDQQLAENNLKNAQLSDFRGKWLIVNFWAEWCAPCLKEVPELNKLHSQRERLNLNIIGVSYDPIENVTIKEIANKWGMQYPMMASEPVPILPFKLPNSLPGNYILNPQGELVATLKGEQTFDSLSKLLITLEKQSSQSE